jgi:hypothetical protein
MASTFSSSPTRNTPPLIHNIILYIHCTVIAPQHEITNQTIDWTTTQQSYQLNSYHIMMMKRKKRSSCSSQQALLILFVSALVCSYFGLFGLHRRVVLTDSSSRADIDIDTDTLSIPSISSTTFHVKPKPKLTDYIQGWNITGNVNWLLDFAIVGFPKAGTSTLMLYLQKQTKSIFIFDQERCEMGYNQHVPLLADLYKNYQPHLKMGIKCPRDLEVDLALANYHQFFPTTKFIVGIRHPILWFQSFYNFRITNDYPMPPPQQLVGRCKRANQGVCTFRANFSNHLQQIEPSRKVFVYHVAQLQDSSTRSSSSRSSSSSSNATTTRATRFRRDLQTFLELSHPLDDPMIWVQPGRPPPASPQRAHELKQLKINICDEQYNDLRRILLEQASHSATWMQTVWLKQQTPNANAVHVSSPEYFRQLLNTWHVDPCDNNNNSNNIATTRP